ncbi:Com family DNA-binding transcriptional regulator [Azorhizobium caulinodans]|uniref:Com family DNA-binding transcriptional regulator n=1 Tax=Azorhizobium caulinodans TaxID=7 RepID=UPI0039EBE82F
MRRGTCRALLFRAGRGAISGVIEIKCRRCGTLNALRPQEPTPERPAQGHACYWREGRGRASKRAPPASDRTGRPVAASDRHAPSAPLPG